MRAKGTSRETLILRSSAMRDLDRVLRKVAPKDVILTFVGESGSGKEVLARRAHELSGRRGGPFVPLNCAAIPESLFESELFGHERGAFTGATTRARGKIESATGGTLLLDEIAELPLPQQAKLLRFLETRRYMRVGGTEKLSADVRLMCSTHRPLLLEVRAARFRADLFFRIQGVTLEVPPLRERREDVDPMLRAFLQDATERHRVAAPVITREALALLRRHDWPGNVRELRTLVESLCLLREGLRIRARDLPAGLQPHRSRAPDDSPRRSISLRLDDTLDTLVGRIVEAVIEEEEGDKRAAARRLGISERTIQRYVAAGRVRVPSGSPTPGAAERPLHPAAREGSSRPPAAVTARGGAARRPRAG